MVRPGIISSDLLGSLIQFSLLHRRATHFLEPATGNRGRLRYAVNFTLEVFRGLTIAMLQKYRLPIS